MRVWRPRFERETLALLGALALHAFVWWAIRGHDSPPDQEASPAPTAKDAIEIGLETAAVETLPELGGIAEPLRPRAVPRVSRAPVHAAPEESLAMLPDSSSSASSPSPSETEETQESAGSGAIDLGIGEDGWKRWVTGPGERVSIPRTRRPFVRAPITSSSGGLREGLEAHDRALGLGPSGRVVTALHTAAHGADAPQLGTARFQVTLSRKGEVEVSLTTASEPVEAWQSVALRAAAELRRKPPRIPSGRVGARWIVDLVADQRFPNGVDPKTLHAPRLEGVAPRLRSVEEGKKEIEELNPTAASDNLPSKVALQESIANTELPGLFLSSKGKAGSYRLGVTPLGTLQAPAGAESRTAGLDLRAQGTFDPSNLGAKAQRHLRVAVVEETFFDE